MTAPQTCEACGARSGDTARFCEQCGERLEAPAPAPAERPATVAHYRLLGELARGGMGVVYRAFDERLGRNVALKMLREDVASDPEFARRFEREARAAAALDHPNILPVFDAGEAEGTLYLVTRLVEGLDLRDLVETGGPLDVDRALALTGQVADALDYAHSRGLVHRDVKPANVLVVSDERSGAEHAYLIDFGITKAQEGDAGVTASGRFVGTPEYAAPEQISGFPVDGRADQYALAGLLYYALAARSPYGGSHIGEVLHAHLHDPAPRLTGVRHGVPGSVHSAVERAFDKDPARRFESCRAFVMAARTGAAPAAAAAAAAPAPAPLATVHDPLPGLGRPPAETEPEPERARSGGHRAAIVATVLILLGVAGAATGAAIGLSGDDDPPPTRQARIETVSRGGTVHTVTVRGEAETVEAPAPEPLDVETIDFTEHDARGYRAGVPAGWRLAKDDVLEADDGGVQRRRTTAAEPDEDVSVVIDHLTGFEKTPTENRADLDRDYTEKVEGYERVGFDDVEVAGRPTAEWRYRLRDDSGRVVERVDLMFTEGDDHFAVLATGNATQEDLAELARRVAETIDVTDELDSAEPGDEDGEPSGHDDRIPASGVYSGTGTQHLEDGSTNPGVSLVMSIDGSGSTVTWEQRGCEARLAPDGFEGERRVYRERSLVGGCDDPGTWEVLRVSETTLEVSWSSDASPLTVSATLER